MTKHNLKYAGIIRYPTSNDNALAILRAVKSKLRKGIYHCYLRPHGVSLDSTTIAFAKFEKET